MNKLVGALLISALISGVGCSVFKEYPVEYDYSYAGKFKKYKSYNFIQQQEYLTDAIDFDRNALEKTIQIRLNALGYKQETEKPNLLISYKLFVDSLQFRGYDQPDIEYWVNYSREDQEEYNPHEYSMQEGTLLIQFFDRKQRRTIWQGYATSLYGDDYLTNSREMRYSGSLHPRSLSIPGRGLCRWHHYHETHRGRPLSVGTKFFRDCYFKILKKYPTFALRFRGYTLSHGVTVALQILVLSVKVRILVGQQIKSRLSCRDLLFVLKNIRKACHR